MFRFLFLISHSGSANMATAMALQTTPDWSYLGDLVVYVSSSSLLLLPFFTLL
jgi:hypothetical protein